MRKKTDDQSIGRIMYMERLFDEVTAAVHNGTADQEVREKAKELEAYYTGGQWLDDYARDERGEWPPELKRGVLSQDALYDLLNKINE